MKKILFAFTMLLAIAACTNKPVTPVENNEESSEVVDKQYESKRVVLQILADGKEDDGEYQSSLR